MIAAMAHCRYRDYLSETEAWLVFPHELEGLSTDEIRAGKGSLATLLLGTSD